MDAARQCTWQWISGHDPSCGATPMIRAPRINGKTTPPHITCFLLSPIFCWNGAPASHWWLRLGSSGLPQDKASSQTCHYFLATVQMGRRDVGTNPYQHVLTWGKIMKLQEAPHKTKRQHQPCFHLFLVDW